MTLCVYNVADRRGGVNTPAALTTTQPWFRGSRPELRYLPLHRPRGRVAEWVGGGKVVLTSWPVDLIRPPCGASADCTSNLPTGQCQAALGELDRRYKGVEFELPATQRWYDADEVAAMLSGAEGEESLTGTAPVTGTP